MKKSLTLSLVFLCGLAACKKDDKGSSSGSAGYWTLGGKTYNVATTTDAGSIWSLSDKDFNTAGLNFMNMPATSGKYRIAGSGAMLDPNQVIIQCVLQTGDLNNSMYNSYNGGPEVYADVTISGDKITVDVPKIWVKNPMSKGTDSLEFTCHAEL